MGSRGIGQLHLLVFAVVLIGPLVLFAGRPLGAEEGTLEQLRDDIRLGPPAVIEEDRHSRRSAPSEFGYGDDSESAWNPVGSLLSNVMLADAIVTLPFWGPMAALNDEASVPAYFPQFPYDEVPGYLVLGDYSVSDRRWAGRLSAEYLEPFHDVQVVAGRLLVSTTSRWGLDAQWDHFEERLPGGRHDRLWVGDSNLVFRFAQHEQAEFRAGLGLNWLDDARQTDFGFNFTYGGDFFLRPPWVVSADIDWGTLGKTGLFRLQTTVGIVIHGVEAYTGYQYFDVGRTHLNCLIGGIRLWF